MSQANSYIGAIVACNKQRIIGVDGSLPWHYSEDLKRFKKETLNSVVIMGRNTWLSFGEKALPCRRNIVITTKVLSDIEHYHSIENAIKNAKQDSENRPIWIIGGAQLYQSALQFIDYFDVTWVDDYIDEDKYTNIAKLIQFDMDIWQQGAIMVNSKEDRLKHQRFVRRKLIF